MTYARAESTVSRFQGLIFQAFTQSLDPASPYVLFDFPNHSNVGDSAIWQGELKALRSFFNKAPLFTCDIINKPKSFPQLSESVQIIMHGGGNLGDLWEAHQLFREQVVMRYPNNKILQMPQSIFFADQANQTRCKEVFSKHKNLSLMVRDETSYATAITLHEGLTMLVPDMALMLGHIRRPCLPSTPIFALLRSDKEKSISDDGEGIISNMIVEDWIKEPFYIEHRALAYIKKIEVLFRLLHWSPMNRLKTWLFNRVSRLRVERGCKMLSQGKVVITDRLHAHILCSLMEIPHVIIDNSYGKLSSFRKAWNTGADQTCKQASSLVEAYKIAQIMLKS